MQVVGQVTVVPQSESVPHQVGSHAHEQRFGVAPPQVWPFVHVPHVSVPPQPSLIVPQLAPVCPHVRRRQESVPASTGCVFVHSPYAVISAAQPAAVALLSSDPLGEHVAR